MSQITDAQTPKEFAAIWEKTHISNKPASDNRHKDVKIYLQKLVRLGVKVEEIGKSFEEREIYRVEWGKGKTKVFMWSQMHGDEPTATPALMDMFAFLQTNRKKLKWVKNLEDSITIRAIPMLNPDGAELFQRRNAQNIDINRDTINLKTPEARLLLNERNQWQPDIGFNLHNQQELTSVGDTLKQAAISVLAVGANPEMPISEGQKRNRRITSLIVQALNQFIKGNIGSYDDSYTPNAFGDTFSDLGTPTILIETGGLHNKDEMFLVKLNFIAYLTALQSLVDGSEKNADVSIYENLPENTSGKLHNFIFRNATVVEFVEPVKELNNETDIEESEVDESNQETKVEKIFKPFTADVAVQRVRRRAELKNPPTFVSRIGDLKKQRGLTEFDVKNYYIISDKGFIKEGIYGNLLFYKITGKIDWNAEDFLNKFPPDAVFSNGVWLKPLPKR
ncbi:MAG: M14 family zinc carboxypeptidase [Aridibacter sp.]